MNKILTTALAGVLSIGLSGFAFAAGGPAPVTGGPVVGAPAAPSSGTEAALQAGYDYTNSVKRPAAVDPSGIRLAHPPTTDPDPCENSNIAKSSAIIAATTASSQLVALSAGKKIYVCGMSGVVSGAAGTLKLTTGTGTACATGGTDVSGLYTGSVGGIPFSHTGGGMTTPVSQELCAITAGGSVVAGGTVSYVQQ